MQFFALIVLIALCVALAGKMRDADKCSHDVEVITTSAQSVQKGVQAALESCKDGFSQQCNQDIAYTEQQVAAISQAATNAVEDCAGEEPPACMEDINNIIIHSTNISTNSMNAILDCRNYKESAKYCIQDITAAADAGSKLAVDIAKASEDCQNQ